MVSHILVHHGKALLEETRVTLVLTPGGKVGPKHIHIVALELMVHVLLNVFCGKRVTFLWSQLAQVNAWEG